MHSEQIDKLAAALCKVQASLKPAIKDSNNPYFDSKYADLESVWDAARDPLTANGFAVAQIGYVADGTTFLETKLLHSSGQWLSSVLPLYLKKEDPQAQGSAITYARRYALAAIVGIIQADDDGNAASKPAPKVETKKAPALEPVLEQPAEVETTIPDDVLAILKFAEQYEIPHDFISTLITKKYGDVINDVTITELWVDIEAITEEIKVIKDSGKKVTRQVLQKLFRSRLNANDSNNRSVDSTSSDTGAEAAGAASETEDTVLSEASKDSPSVPQSA